MGAGALAERGITILGLVAVVDDVATVAVAVVVDVGVVTM
jgi:hypothetical protein